MKDGESHLSEQPVPGTWFAPRDEQPLGPLFGLAPDGVFRAPLLALGAVVSYTTFSPLPELFPAVAVLFSVALSVGMVLTITSRVYPSLRMVTRHPALRSSDFPPLIEIRSDPPPFQDPDSQTPSTS